MTGLSVALLLGAATLVAYTFVGYPLALLVLGRSSRAPRVRPDQTARGAAPEGACSGWEPPVSVTVAVYNEEAQLPALLDNLLALDYPPDRLQILILSDASTDRTDEIAQSYAERGVELVRLATRRGKTAAENAARAHVRGEIIVNTDASIRLDPLAIRRLVSAFADPSVGVASGRDVSVAAAGVAGNSGEAGYVGYEMWVRDLETRAGGIVGASGCLFAMRRSLHAVAVREDLSRDFASALIAEEHGMRAVSVPGATCFVPRTTSLHREYRRKVRTVTRGLATLFAYRHLLNPFRHGRFGWMLFSHKLCRWLVPWALVAAVVGALLVAIARGVGDVALACLLVAAWLGWTCWRYADHPRMPRPLSIILYAAAANAAVLQAWMRFIRGTSEPIWEPTRRETVPTSTV